MHCSITQFDQVCISSYSSPAIVPHSDINKRHLYMCVIVVRPIIMYE